MEIFARFVIFIVKYMNKETFTSYIFESIIALHSFQYSSPQYLHFINESIKYSRSDKFLIVYRKEKKMYNRNKI